MRSTRARSRPRPSTTVRRQRGDGRLLRLGRERALGAGGARRLAGGTTARIARERRELDGRTVIKQERMPDGRLKLILKDEQTGEFADVVRDS